MPNKENIRAAAGFIIIILLIMIMSVINYFHSVELAELTDHLYEHPLQVSNAVLEIRGRIFAIHRTMKDVVLSQTEAEIKDAVQIVDEEETRILELFKIAEDQYLGNPAQIIDSINTFKGWRPIREEVISLVRGGEVTKAVQITRGRGARYSEKIHSKMIALVEFAKNKAREFILRADNVRDTVLFSQVVLTLVILASGIFISLQISRVNSKKLKELNTEISKRKEAAHELFESKNRLDLIIKNSEGGFWDWNVQTGEILFDDGWRDLLGLDKDYQATYPWLEENIFKEDLPQFKSALIDYLMGEKKIFESEYRLKTASNNIIWISSRAVAVEFDNENKPVKIVGTLRNQSDKREAEEELKVFRKIVSVSSDFMSLLDRDFVYRAVNETYLQAFSKKTDEIVGYSASELLGKEVFENGIEPHLKRVLKGETINYEIWLDFPGLGKRYVDVKFYPIRDGTGPVEGIANVTRDITEQKYAQEELKKSQSRLVAINKELESFSYSVSHDLKTPLRHVSGFSQLLKDRYAKSLDEDGVKLVTEIEKSSERMMDLIESLLDLSRVQQHDLHEMEVDLSKLVQKEVNAFKDVNPGREIELMTPEKLMVRGDLKLLEIVFENLLGNSIKYSSKKDRTVLELGEIERAGRKVIYLKDNGAGFDQGKSDMLFAPFQRLHSNSEFEGTGIGLATVQRIIHKHQGTIWAEGEKDKGATFFITLGE